MPPHGHLSGIKIMDFHKIRATRRWNTIFISLAYVQSPEIDKYDARRKSFPVWMQKLLSTFRKKIYPTIVPISFESYWFWHHLKRSDKYSRHKWMNLKSSTFCWFLMISAPSRPPNFGAFEAARIIKTQQNIEKKSCLNDDNWAFTIFDAVRDDSLCKIDFIPWEKVRAKNCS